MSTFTRKRREELFGRIARAKGGAAAMLLDPQVLAEAELNLKKLKPLVAVELHGTIERIRAQAADSAGANDIFAAAHDMCGLAGAYGFAGVGLVAGAIRIYGENQTDGFEPDWGLLQLLTQMLARTFEQPDAAPPAMLASMCREAVVKVMMREGREVPEGAL